MPNRRAVGIVRVSRVGEREGDRFASPLEQRERIEAACEREGLLLLETREELDVSGGTELMRRPGLSQALASIEAGQADVIVVAYFDRLFRSLKVQAELLERVEAAGGKVLAADVGEVSSDSAAKWLSATMLGMVAEYVRRTTAERVAGAQRRAVEQGRVPFPLIDGLRRGEGGTVEIDPETVDAVREAFNMRASAATVQSIRDHLRENGIERSYHGVMSLLRSKVALGEVQFGTLRGTVPAIVDRDTWERAQRVSLPRGRKPKSDRLLARLGILRCGTCGSRMVIASSNNSGYKVYRCPPTGDCERRVAISADKVEQEIVTEVKRLLDGMKATASAADGTQQASKDLDHAQAAFDGAIQAFSGLETEPAAITRLRELRDARDTAREAYEGVIAMRDATTVAISVGDDWDLLTLEEQRALITTVVESVTVAPGRGSGRVTIHLRT